MSAVTPTPFVMKDCLFVIDTAGDSYEKAITSVAFTPSTSIIVAKAVSPGAVYTDADAASWTCDITYLQDWEDADGLSRYLFDNEGSSFPCTFEPIAGGATITATIVVTPGSIGGAVGSFAEATVSLGVTGKPVIGA